LKCLTFGNHVSSHTSSSTFATYQMRHNLRHYRLASTCHLAPPCMVMDIPQHYLLKQVSPTYTSHKICNLHNLDSGGTPPPPTQSSISSGVYGSLCCKQCLWIRLKLHAECWRTGGSSARPKIPDAAQCNPCQATHQREVIQKVSRDSMLWPMTKTPRNYAKQSTRTSEGICTLASSQQTQT